jgi:glycosyltransferase involved in cell wall biosynthesis
MLTSPTISVVIPMFNASGTISRAIGSVFQQSVVPIEIIVVDDGSIDDGAEVIRMSFQGIKIVSQSNLGGSAARNAGILTATSEWIAFLDADDIWLPNHLETLANIIRQYPQVHVASTAFQRWKPGTSFKVHQKKIKCGVIDYFKEQSKGLGVVHSSTVLIKRESFNEIGYFSELKIGEDLDMWERLALRFETARTTEVTAIYSETADGVIAKFSQAVNFKFDELQSQMYISTNLLENSSFSNCKSLYQYQNYLRYLQVRQCLFYNQVTFAKRKSANLLGPAHLRHAIFLWTVRLSPAIILKMLVKLKKLSQ